MDKKRLPKRIWELDFIRGVCVLLMVMDHCLYDLGFIFFRQWFPDGGSGLLYSLCDFARNFYWQHPLRTGVRVLVLICFIGICGLCCSFSRSNLRRGLKLLAVALLITVVTAGMDAVLNNGADGYIIRCGVLHMLAASILLYAAVSRAGRPLLLLSAALLIAAGLYFAAHPLADGVFWYVLGLGNGSYSADYFPLLPWCGYFLLGAAAGGLLYRRKVSYFPQHADSRARRPVDFIGRHALWAYVLHQPLVYGLLTLVGLVFV